MVEEGAGWLRLGVKWVTYEGDGWLRREMVVAWEGKWLWLRKELGGCGAR